VRFTSQGRVSRSCVNLCVQYSLFEAGGRGRFKHLTGILRALSTRAERMQSKAKKVVSANPASGHPSSNFTHLRLAWAMMESLHPQPNAMYLSWAHNHTVGLARSAQVDVLSHPTESSSFRLPRSKPTLVRTSKATGAKIKLASRYPGIGRIQTLPWENQDRSLTFCASEMKNVLCFSSSVHSAK
jgi:hypothetical protein